MSKRDFLSTADLTRPQLDDLLDLASRSKRDRSKPAPTAKALAGRTLGMLFFQPSLRTRVSFEVAMDQLGGHTINLGSHDLYELEPEEQAVMDGRAEEHVKDAARTLSRYVDVLGVRAVSRVGKWERDRQELLLRSYSRHSAVPVINLETCFEHPCQAIADALTMREHLGSLGGRHLTLLWCNHPEPKSLGPTHSLLQVAAMLGMQVTLAHPLGFEVDGEVLERSRGLAAQTGGSVRVVNDLAEAADGTQVLYARSWGCTKYWDDIEREEMVKRSLTDWKVDEQLMARTDDALLMHPLPVRRNVAATDAVLDGPRSAIYDQAENRAHAQKALLLRLLQE